jgi:anti-anti-sigma factor
MAATSPGAGANVFAVEQEGDTLILIPPADLGESSGDRIADGASRILARLSDGRIKNVVVDFCMTDYFGSTALSVFIRLWTRVHRQGGQLIVCNISDHEREILQVSRLDQLWPICATRAEALQAAAKS